MMEQGSESWFTARMGKVSASRMADLMAKTKSGPGAARKNYMMELLCQRLTGAREEGFTSGAMLRGIELEPVARSAYEFSTGAEVEQCGFILHPDIPDLGASPDGLVVEQGLIEIKCPNTAQHIACLQSGTYDKKYWWQMQCQMACTGRDWCDFVSFDDRLPEELQIFCDRVERDEKAISEMLGEVQNFLQELEQIENDLRERMEKAA